MEIQFKEIKATITAIHQWQTYGGLLEGVPTDKLNQQIFRRAPERAKELTYMDNFHLIKAEQTPIDLGRKYPFGEPMSLPGTTCVLALKCWQTSDPDLGGHSELTLICFQEKFALPLDQEILDQIAQLDWFSLSKDVSFDDY